MLAEAKEVVEQGLVKVVVVVPEKVWPEVVLDALPVCKYTTREATARTATIPTTATTLFDRGGAGGRTAIVTRGRSPDWRIIRLAI